MEIDIKIIIKVWIFITIFTNISNTIGMNWLNSMGDNPSCWWKWLFPYEVLSFPHWPRTKRQSLRNEVLKNRVDTWAVPHGATVATCCNWWVQGAFGRQAPKKIKKITIIDFNPQFLQLCEALGGVVWHVLIRCARTSAKLLQTSAAIQAWACWLIFSNTVGLLRVQTRCKHHHSG